MVIANRALVHDSQANREAVDGDSSRSPPKTGPGVSGEESEAAQFAATG